MILRWTRNLVTRLLLRLFGPRYVAFEPPGDPNELGAGKTFFVTNDEGQEVQVLADRVVGNRADPKMFEINGRYLISMLEFYCQLEGRRPTAEEIRDWNTVLGEIVGLAPPRRRRVNVQRD